MRECGLKFEEMINCFKITERLRRRYLKGFCWYRSFKAPLKAVSGIIKRKYVRCFVAEYLILCHDICMKNNNTYCCACV